MAQEDIRPISPYKFKSQDPFERFRTLVPAPSTDNDDPQVTQRTNRSDESYQDTADGYSSSTLRRAAQDALSQEPMVYNSYSGADIVATILVPGEKAALDLGNLQTISYSTHRENTPVRAIGHVNPCGFIKGPRTISGSLIFTQFNKYTFYQLEQYRLLANARLFGLGDMLPPFDIIITAANEYGSFSKMKILGVTIIDEGGVMSIDDMITEETFTYMARGIQPMIDYIPDNIFSDGKPNELDLRLPRAFKTDIFFR